MKISLNKPNIKTINHFGEIKEYNQCEYVCVYDKFIIVQTKSGTHCLYKNQFMRIEIQFRKGSEWLNI